MYPSLAFDASDIARFPMLTLTLPNGATLELKGEDYLQRKGTDPDTGMPLYWCAVGLPEENGTPSNVFTLGQLFLRKLYAEFDAENGRMDFATPVADCQKAAGF